MPEVGAPLMLALKPGLACGCWLEITAGWGTPCAASLLSVGKRICVQVPA